MELRRKAEKALGPRGLFDLRVFHDVFLAHFGSLDIFERAVDEYIATTLNNK
jgi:uncharacterized protein (DUF885 family)